MNKAAQESAQALIVLEGKDAALPENQKEVGEYVWGLVQLGVEEFHQTKETSDQGMLRWDLARLVGKSVAAVENNDLDGWKDMTIRKRVEDVYLRLRREFIHKYSECE